MTYAEFLEKFIDEMQSLNKINQNDFEQFTRKFEAKKIVNEMFKKLE